MPNRQELPEKNSSQGLAGVRPDCGCVTAALSLHEATKKDIRDFYRDMADSGREVRQMDAEIIRAKWGECPHR